MGNEIKAQLVNLGKQIDDLTMHKLTQSLSGMSKELLSSETSKVDESDESEDDEVLPESNLYRDESQRKWNNPLIDKQKDEMSKQLIHLAKQHKSKSSNEFVYM